LKTYWDLTFHTGLHANVRVLSPGLGQWVSDVKTAYLDASLWHITVKYHHTTRRLELCMGPRLEVLLKLQDTLTFHGRQARKRWLI